MSCVVKRDLILNGLIVKKHSKCRMWMNEKCKCYNFISNKLSIENANFNICPDIFHLAQDASQRPCHLLGH